MQTLQAPQSVSKASTTPRAEAPLPVDRSSSTTEVSSVNDAIAITGGYTLDLSIRFARLGGIVICAVLPIVGLMVLFGNGVAVNYFAAKSKSPAEQIQLLDYYNSYSGSIASVFLKPIELIVGVVVPVVVLRAMADSALRPQQSWTTAATALAVSVVVGYLLGNGFNALNVQLRPLPLEPAILSSDLSHAENISVSARTSNLTHSISEATPDNLITNTVLRNAILPRVAIAQPRCDWQQVTERGTEGIPRTVLEYGFAQRDWQSRLLQQAVEPKSLSIVVNATNRTANDGVHSKNLPMQAAVAADLFLYSMYLAPKYFPWGVFTVNRTTNATFPHSPTRLPAAQVAGLLPVEATASEQTKREWVVRESTAIVNELFTKSVNMSRSDMRLEFSHVDISPSIEFDAVTLEADVAPELLNPFQRNGTRYAQLQSLFCGPSPAQCAVNPARYVLDPLMFHSPDQVQAFAACANRDGTDELWFDLVTPNVRHLLECQHGTNSSLLVVSIAKRLSADALTQNTTVTKVGELVPDERSVVITNLRLTYSVTVGRLRWTLDDLATTFGAACKTTNCMGLNLTLSSPLGASISPASSSSRQQLIVGADAVPLALLSLPREIQWQKPRYLPLVMVHEPPASLVKPLQFDPLKGRLLLKHNVKHIAWQSSDRYDSSCQAVLEERSHLVLNNHMYIEHGLQPAYTAATFLLFQNGMVRDVVPGQDTLAFDGNSQYMMLVASVPATNVWLTMAGCGLVVIGLVFLLVKRAVEMDPLRGIESEDRIVRVLLDEAQYPPLLVQRQLRCQGELVDTAAESLVIHKISFARQDAERNPAESV